MHSTPRLRVIIKADDKEFLFRFGLRDTVKSVTETVCRELESRRQKLMPMGEQKKQNDDRIKSLSIRFFVRDFYDGSAISVYRRGSLDEIANELKQTLTSARQYFGIEVVEAA